MWTLVRARLSRHLVRSLMTGLAVVVGVGFMAGTMILTDTMGRSFDQLFATGNEGIDVVVARPPAFETDAGEVGERVDADLLGRIRAVEGVAAAAGTVEGMAQLSHLDGTPLPGMTVTIGVGWIDDARLNPFELADGTAPDAPDEVVLDLATAERERWEIGDEVLVSASGAPAEMTVVGTATYGDIEGVPGVAAVAVEPSAAQALFADPGSFDTLVVAADEATSAAVLTDRVAAALDGEDVDVTSGAADTAEQQADFEEDLAFFEQALLAFAAVALFVGMFIIANTFAITVAQRSQEMALLRAVGASRRQVLGTVLGESAGIGILASAVGLGLGVGIARVLDSFLAAVGIEVPAGATVVTQSTVTTSFLVGTTITLVSALVPALRASRIAPLAALRDSATEPVGPSRARAAVGAVLLAVGLGLGALGVVGGGDDALSSVGAGAAITFLAVVVLGPVLGRRVVHGLGAGVVRVSRINGRLARENATRNPRRTATTASALMIGVTLVGFITILAGSSKASVTEAIDRSLRADFTIDPGAPAGAGGGFGPEIEGQVAAVASVAVVSPVRSAPVSTDGGTEKVVGVDPATVEQVMDLEVRAGSVADLSDGGVAVQSDWAVDNAVGLGDPVTVTFARTGPVELPVRAVLGAEVLGTVDAAFAVGLTTYAENVTDQLDAQVFVTLDDDADAEAATAALGEVLVGWPGAELQDQATFKEAVTSEIDMMLNLTYGLLALAVVIALIGIANTLALAVHERTRELGLLRAVGMSRRQVRSTVRWEALLISLLGAALGTGLAVSLAAAVVAAMDDTGAATLTLPLRPLAVIALFATAAGVVAAVGPARRAARLDVLAAIAA